MQNKIPVFILNELIILPNQEIKIDLTNEVSKKIIFEATNEKNNEVLVVAPKMSKTGEPSLLDFPKVGVIASIKSKIELSSGSLRIVLHGEKRVKIEKYFQNKETGILKCSVDKIELPKFENNKKVATTRKLLSLIKEYINDNKSVGNSILSSINDNDDLESLTDIITSFLPLSFEKKLDLMAEINSLKRAQSLINTINEELSIIKIDKELDSKIRDSLDESQREYILKEKLREINKELGNTKDEEINELIKSVNNLEISDITKNKLLNEIRKYENLSEYSPECGSIKNYLDLMLNLPWNTQNEENLNAKNVNEILNNSHYGLKEIKDRIVEYVTLKSKQNSLNPPIICLVGPPGVGKTSIAMSIASALNRKFVKISVGGLNDSTELVGSRRTYLGAAPGKIMQGIIKCEVNNPLILIDEVDKMVKDYKGDPAGAMLEILDETQNRFFVDNYIEEPFDLSKVFFILTANEEDKIPKTLSDRMEIIHIDSYTIYEKIDIAKNYLLKNTLLKLNSDLKVNKDVLEYLVTGYTKEPGVRELKILLEKLVRKILVYEENSKSITINLINRYLGNRNESFTPEINNYGVSNILACNFLGGEVSHVEVSKVPGTGKITVTGLAGESLNESAKVVSSFLASEYNLNLNEFDIHVHFIFGGQKKDGPSAGVSIAVAMLSAFKMQLIPSDVAFTGELTLKGNILPIGGLKEKIIAASSYGIKKIYIPKANQKDLESLPIDIFDLLDIKMIDNFQEIYDNYFF